MAMQQCAAGKHFYNSDTYETCPFCDQEESDNNPQSNNSSGDSAMNKTEMLGGGSGTASIEASFNDQNAMAQKTQPIIAETSKPKTTIITSGGASDIESSASAALPVSGWLVIVDGPGKGRDFRLIQGENKIGRDAGMEVCLDFGADSDSSVSRDSHAVVVYDNHANEFFVERGASRNLPLVNDKTVRRDQDLNANDIIQLGNTKLMFVPLCGGDFNWS